MITLNTHEICASIKDRYANIVYSFDFENNSIYNSNELKFEITIDPKAFISKFSANIDGELFIGKTKEKERASKEYNEAKEKNENAILISQPHKNIPNVFEIKTNIDSKSKIFLTIQIEQYLQKTFGFNQFVIQILRNFDKYNIKQNFDDITFKLNIEDKSGIQNIDIPIKNNDDIIIDKQIMDKMNKKCEINGRITGISSINELTLKYKISGESDESHILFDNKSNIFCHIISDIITDSIIIDEKDIDEGQNDEINNDILIPRRVMLLIDRSGSMSGSKWDKTISSTIMAIKQLRNGYDRFGIILFDNDIEILPYVDEKRCILSDDKSIKDSIEALENAKVGGATNINDAVLKAIKMIKNDILTLNNDNNYRYNFFMNQIIFITDGKPNHGQRDTNKIITNVENVNDLSKIDKYNNKISIFSFGVGNNENDSNWIKDLNHSFLKLLSVNNNGFYQRIKRDSADTALGQYFKILSKPVLSNINIVYKNKNISNLTKTKFNTLYSGNDLIICGKIENKQNLLLLTITATTGKEIKENDKLITKPITISKEMKININPNHNNDECINNIQRIWAYLTLQQFATEKLIYNDMIEMDQNEEKEKSVLPLSLALKYKFVTPWTSMIVVKKKDNEIQKNDQQKDIEDGLQKDQEKRKSAAIYSSLTPKKHRIYNASNMFTTVDHFACKHTKVSRSVINQVDDLKAGNKTINFLSKYSEDESEKTQDLFEQMRKKMTDRSKNVKRAHDRKLEKEHEELARKEREKEEMEETKKRLRDEAKKMKRSADRKKKRDGKKKSQTVKKEDDVIDMDNNYGYAQVHDAMKTFYMDKNTECTTPAHLILFAKKNGIKGVSFTTATKYFKARRNDLNVVPIEDLMNDEDENDEDELSDSMKRIIKELADLECNPISNCLVEASNDDKTKWKASVNGLKDSPYEGGIFYLDIKFPNDYPLKPAKFTFITKIYHCNINENGEINLDLLNNKWSPVITIRKILCVIMNLLINPNIDNPFMPHIAKLYKDDKDQHDKIAKEWAQKYANHKQM